MSSFFSTLIQQDISSSGDFFVDVHPDDLDPSYYAVSHGSGIGTGMLLIILLIIATIALILIVRAVGKSSKRTENNNQNKIDGFEPVKSGQRFNSFYVSDDGTIVRGHKDTAGNLSSPVVIESHNEQKEALSLIKESAEAGVAEAQYYLGLCYEQGSVVPKDLEEAKKWYRLAAGQSYPQAKFRLGKLLMEDKQ